MNAWFYCTQFLSGLLITLILMLAALCSGLVLAFIFTIGKQVGPYFLRKSIDCVVFFICGTPLLIQIFLVYYGLGQFELIRDSFLWFILKEPMACAIIALAVNTACYTTVLLTGAIHSVPHDEVAACEALGMSQWLALRRVILPRAIRIALHAYSNEVIMVLKGTSLASTITILDLMGVTQQLIAQTYQVVPFYLLVGLIYLILNGLISVSFKMISNKLLRHLVVKH